MVLIVLSHMLILYVHMFAKKAVQSKVGISSLALLEKNLKA